MARAQLFSSTGLLHFAGCTAESEIDARFFGDEMMSRPRMLTVAHGSRFELMSTMMRTAHQGSPPLTRAARIARAAVGGMAEFRKRAASHCDVARILGARMGLSEPVQESLRHLYERWDDNGMPGDLRGPRVPVAVRIMQVAEDADVACQYGGTELASRAITRRAGSGLDPEAARVFLSLGDEPYKGLSAVADFADLKSMWTIGHSRGVADLAERAAGLAGLAAAEVVTLLAGDPELTVSVTTYADGRQELEVLRSGPPQHPDPHHTDSPHHAEATIDSACFARAVYRVVLKDTT